MTLQDFEMTYPHLKLMATMRAKAELILHIHLMIDAARPRLIGIVLHPKAAEWAFGKLQNGADP